MYFKFWTEGVFVRRYRSFAIAAALLMLAASLAVAPAIALDHVEPIDGFDEGTLVTISHEGIFEVILEFLMPVEESGLGYGRISPGQCSALGQAAAAGICDDAGTLGLAVFERPEHGGYSIDLSFADLGWVVKLDLEPVPDDPFTFRGNAEFYQGGEDETFVETIAVWTAIGFLSLELTREQFLSAQQ